MAWDSNGWPEAVRRLLRTSRGLVRCSPLISTSEIGRSAKVSSSMSTCWARVPETRTSGTNQTRRSRCHQRDTPAAVARSEWNAFRTDRPVGSVVIGWGEPVLIDHGRIPRRDRIRVLQAALKAARRTSDSVQTKAERSMPIPVATSANRNNVLVWSPVVLRVWSDISPPPGSPWSWFRVNHLGIERRIQSVGCKRCGCLPYSRAQNEWYHPHDATMIRLFGRWDRWSRALWMDTVPR